MMVRLKLGDFLKMRILLTGIINKKTHQTIKSLKKFGVL